MENYTVYFEIYGKKMKVKVLAKSVNDAESQIKEKIKFHKVLKEDVNTSKLESDIFNSLMDIINGKTK